jgi:hypothetical protein
MILLVFVMVFSDLHQVVSDGLSVESVSRARDHVTVPMALVSLFLIGSLICVMLVEKEK